MNHGSRAREIMNYSFLVAFADDGTIDEAELAFIKRLALKDGVIDEQEKEVLTRIFDRLDADSLAPTVRDEIEKFREEFDF
jgi:tellurite resistance protein